MSPTIMSPKPRWAALPRIICSGPMPICCISTARVSASRCSAWPPNGVLVTPDGAHLYVAVTNERRLIAFTREPFIGNLTEIGSLSLPAAAGQYFGRCGRQSDHRGPAQPDARQAFRADPAKPSPSEVFRVRLDKSGVPQSYETIFCDDGARSAPPAGRGRSASAASDRLGAGQQAAGLPAMTIKKAPHAAAPFSECPFRNRV